jgi:NADH:ubiquinone oxidoreductase subunit F (NADH-binding)
VVDGLSLLGSALGARRVLLATGPDVPSGPAIRAARGSGVQVLPLAGGFVAGQESALVNQVNGRGGVPTDPLVPVYRRGVDHRPTLVLNAETLAQLALLARFGAGWFRSVGTASDPGTFLLTLSASSPSAMTHPGVLEVPRGLPLRAALDAAGSGLDRVAAVLVGGYHGAWVPGSAIDVRLTAEDLARFGATPGAGVIHVLDRDTCPLELSASVAGYLAGQGARQCGPCVNGLPRLAQALQRLAVPGAGAGDVGEIERLRDVVNRRGACAHPDGTARFVASTMRVFAEHVETHLEGACDARPRRLDQV